MLKFIAAAALATTAMAGAQAVTIVGKGAYSLGPAAGEQLILTFDAPLAPGFALAGTGDLFTGSVSGQAAALPGNGTQYMAVRTNRVATLTGPFARGLSLDVGSVDSYNSLVFKGPNGFSQTFTGSQLAAAAPALGQQSGSANNFRVFFDFGNQAISSVEFRSSGNSFEFDNVAGGVVPEPATWAMMIAGFGLVGFSMRRRRAGMASVHA